MPIIPTEPIRRRHLAFLRDRIARLRGLHGDERGTISIMAVFSMLMFTMLLVMVTNVARHADDKIRLQNAADAASQTGTVVVARGMNSIAFTNHLLCEVFALTAYMREAKAAEQGTASLVPEILAEWERTARVFEQAGQSSGHSKFQRLGAALQSKIPLEQQVVDDFVLMSAEHSRLTLPVFEYILGGPDWNGSSGGTGTAASPDPLGGFIPRFQRAVVQNTPLVSHLAATEIAQRHGRNAERQHDDRTLESRLWRTDVQMLGLGQIDEYDPITRTLPVIDPSPAGPDSSVALIPAPYDSSGRTYFKIALRQRRDVAKHYLKLWISDWMKEYFDFGDDNNDYFLHRRDDFAEGMTTAKMSNLLNLWRAATCAHLDGLLNDEYPFTNVPHVIRSQPQGQNGGQTIEREYSYVGVAYWTHLTEMAPGVFKNPLQQAGQRQVDTVAFTQTSLYIPRGRLVKRGGSWVRWVWNGKQYIPIPYRDNWPEAWDMFNQNWMARIRPATSESILSILQQSPAGGSGSFQPPQLNGVTMEEIRAINTH
jgi:hypothetical protein